MPFILPVFMLLERGSLMQKSPVYRINFLKNIFYSRIAGYLTFLSSNLILESIS